MIKIQNLVPSVYYNRSRDFQLLGRVYDIVFNFLKNNVDTISNLYIDEMDDKLFPLLAITLGFKQTHEYNIEQLKDLCCTFIKILRNKGNLNSVQDLLNLIANVEGNSETYYWSINEEKNPYLLNIYIPLSITDTSLLEDMLTYILPVGMSYRIVKELLVQSSGWEDYVYFANDRALMRVEHGSNYQASQVVQGETYSQGIEESSIPGFGRIEDMRVAGEGDITDYVDETQTDTNIILPISSDNEG